MSIPMTFAGHHTEVTPALKNYAVEKLSRLENLGDHITRIAVTLTVEKMDQIAKATLHVKGAELHASHTSMDMYTSIDGLLDKLNRQVKKHREELTAHN